MPTVSLLNCNGCSVTVNLQKFFFIFKWTTLEQFQTTHSTQEHFLIGYDNTNENRTQKLSPKRAIVLSCSQCCLSILHLQILFLLVTQYASNGRTHVLWWPCRQRVSTRKLAMHSMTSCDDNIGTHVILCTNQSNSSSSFLWTQSYASPRSQNTLRDTTLRHSRDHALGSKL